MKQKFLLIAVVCLAASLLITACTPAPMATQAVDMQRNSSESFGYSAPAAAPAQEKAASGGNAPMKPLAETTAERIVIKNAELSLLVDQPGAAMSSISGMASEMGGFVVTSRLFLQKARSGEELPQAQITIRVPAEKLDEALTRIKALVKGKEDIRSENVTGQDVTKEYTDLQSRLRNLEAAEKQLSALMEQAKKMDDIMTIYDKLTQVREQIEVLKGQIKFYEESAALSAINVTLLATGSAEPLSVGGWQPVGVARDALQTLLDTAQILTNVLIWLVIYFLPLGLFFFLVIRLALFIGKRLLGKKAKSTPPAPPAPPEGPEPQA